MKLRVIAKDEKGKEVSIKLKKEEKFLMPNEEFEVDDERGKELLRIKYVNSPIVEKIEISTKNKKADNNDIEETN